MGANMSRIENGNGISQGKFSRVMKFQSTAKWNAHFNAVKQTNKLMVIDFTAIWCGPCQAMAPIIDEYAVKYTDVEFIKIDVDQLEDVAKEFQVEAMPTFVLLKKGILVGKVIGAKKDELLKMIEKHRAY